MFSSLREIYRNYRETLEDGRYGAAQSGFWSHMFGKAKDQLPDAKSTIAKHLPLLTKLSGFKMLWTAAIATVSLTNVIWGGLALVGSALSFGAIEYFRCKRAREQLMTEENFAGQTVRGRRGDLSRLHKAQQKIVTLASTFNNAASPEANAEIAAVIDSVKDARSRILVINDGPVIENSGRYEFFQPHVKKPEPAPLPPLPPLPLVALEEALPPQMREKVHSRRRIPVPEAAA